MLLFVTMVTPFGAKAQIGGTGTIEGTVADPSGAVIVGAQVTALNVSTGVQTVRTTTQSGRYSLAPLQPSTYRLTITASGFESLVRDNITLNGLQVIGLDLTLKVGSASQTVTVSDAPPPLETTNAVLGGAIDNNVYAALPIEMGEFGANSQRRASDVAFLVLGVTANLTSGNPDDEPFIINGNPSSTQMYVDGLPFSSPSVVGDPRYIWTSMSAEVVDQFQVKTTGYSAEYGGLGVENFTVKSGSNKIHGTLYSIARNTAFDASGFIPATNSVTGALMKTPEHQWENSINAGFPIWHDKLFLFGSYMDYRFSSITLPNYETIPTQAELCGDFSASDAGGKFPIFDPSTQTASTTAPTRTQFRGASYTSAGCGTGPVTANVIPQSEISSQARYLQQYWKGVNYANANSTNNFIGSYAYGIADWSTTNRLDYVISARQTMNLMYAFGRQSTAPMSSQTTDDGPFPYRAAKAYNPRTSFILASHTFLITPNLVNQLGWGLAQYHSNTFNLELANSAWSAANAGISGLPPGQATASFPELTWSGNNVEAQWGGGAGSGGFSSTSNNTFSFKDNLQWVHGKHSVTFGTQWQWLSFHNIASQGGTSPLTLGFASTETAQFSSGTTINANTGLTYASFLMGALHSATYTEYSAGHGETRTLNHQDSFYVNDDYRINPKLTVNLGLRWEMYTPLREQNNQLEFMNPNVTNSATGTPGIMQYAGNGTDSCNCSSPIHTYYKNVGPRVGVAYSLDSKTVIRASYGIYYGLSNGGLGSSGVSASGLQNGFSAAPNPVSPGLSQPAFYINNSGYNSILSNSNYGGPGFSVTAPPIIDPLYGTYYSTNAALTSTEKFSQTLGYLDPKYGGRPPEFPSWSFGFQRLLTKDITATVSYVGNEAHFLYASGARGIHANQMDPKYLALQAVAGQTSTPANVAAAAAIIPGIAYPYPTFPQTSPGTIGQMLKPFPQFSGLSDLFSSVSNSNYNGLQISIVGRETHGLTFMLNYTYSKTIDNAGTFRSGYAIPAGFVANEPTKSWAIDKADRSLSLIDQPQNITANAKYELPFGKGHMGGGNPLVSNITGGWAITSIYTYVDGGPLAITQSTACTGSAGTCMPSYNRSFSGDLMPNGKWGKNATYKSLATTPYINPGAFLTTTATNFPNQNGGYLIGDSSRTAPYGLFGPSNYNIDGSVRRTFSLWKDGRVRFVFETSVFNAVNHVWFGSTSTANSAGATTIVETVGASNFGTITKQANSPRQFQFAGHINF
ncbi:MAG: TonB-dependent receptor [Formivibrio sp.]|nr:TonB-dependent receptor [Formivibrio sp.]